MKDLKILSEQIKVTLQDTYSLDLENLHNEEWLDIPNYDGVYQCSNYGRIKSLARQIERQTKHGLVICYRKDKIRKPTKVKVQGTKTEAFYIKLSLDSIKKTDTVSQWVGITFIGEKKKGYHFQHKNKNSLDNRLENIEQVTIKNSKSNDFKHLKREVHNLKSLPKPKLKIIRDDGKVFSFTDIVNTYGKSAYFNILKGFNVRKHKWEVIKL